MKARTMIATITLAALPFFAAVGAEHADHHSEQAAVEQSAGSGMMANHAMGQGMMNVIDQVKNDLALLANENDPAVLHKRLAQDRTLLDQIHAHMSQSMPGMTGSMMSGQSMMPGGMMSGGTMSGGMMSGGMMSGQMSNCPGYGQQPKK